MFKNRLDRVRAVMQESGTESLLLSVGSDLPWLIGYSAMPLERLTMLVVPVDGPVTLVLPKLEIARVVEHPELFSIQTWDEQQDPVAMVADLVGPAQSIALGSHTWSRFLIALQQQLPNRTWQDATAITGALRAVKDAHEISRLQFAANAVDAIALSLQQGEIPLIGRSESEISADLGRRILESGHAKVNFAIVASGENSASPHHHAGSRIVQPNEIVLCDFGGTTAEPKGEPGYCSDLTRCVYTGEPPKEFAEAYESLRQSQQLGFEAAKAGTPAAAVDAAARDHLIAAGLGEWFVHRLGHGIGVEAHEDPYLVEGNEQPLAVGNAFSIEPGFYISGKWGARIEDIAITTEDGPLRLNTVDHALAVVEA